MITKYLKGTYTYIPEFNDNKNLPENEQIKVVIKKPTFYERDDFEEYKQVGEDIRIVFDKKKVLKCIQSIENVINDGKKLTTIDELTEYDGYRQLVLELFLEIVKSDDAKE